MLRNSTKTTITAMEDSARLGRPSEASAPAAFISDLNDAKRAIPQLRALVDEISTLIATPTELASEADYAAKVTPKIETVTTQYQSLASFLQEHKKELAHEKDFRSLQREFVGVMQELQLVQRHGATRREALCDADFLATTKVSSVDIQLAKEEVAEAGQIAAEAIVVKQLFQEVGAIVVEQGKGIDQIQRKVEHIRIEIGHGVDELQHARRLQREAQQKYCYFVCIGLLVVAAIVAPIVVSVT